MGQNKVINIKFEGIIVEKMDKIAEALEMSTERLIRELLEFECDQLIQDLDDLNEELNI